MRPALLLLGLLAAAPAAAYDRPFLRQSLDKTVVVKPGQSYTVPAPEGSGTRYIYPEHPKPPPRVEKRGHHRDRQ